MPGEAAYLDVVDVAKWFRATPVLQGLGLQVRAGEFVSLLGPSGCGKTTLLRIVAGLLAADRGRVILDGADITRVPARQRNGGGVVQGGARAPHRRGGGRARRRRGRPRAEGDTLSNAQQGSTTRAVEQHT